MGESLRTVCAPDDMPAVSTVFVWFQKHPEFTEQYTRAKQESADAMAEEILDISDNGSNDWMERNFGNERTWITNGEALQRSRLRVDTRKWLMAKMKPKVYGEKLDLSGEQTVKHRYEELDDDKLDAAIQARENRISETP